MIDIENRRLIGTQMYDVMLDTDSCDRELAEKSVSDVYKSFGLTPPRVFLWYPSPTKAVAAAMLCAWMQTGQSVMSDRLTSEMMEHVSDKLYPLPSTWRSWLGNLDLNEDSICYSRRFLDLKQLTNANPESASFGEEIDTLMRIGTHVRDQISRNVRAEMNQRLRNDASFAFWQDTLGEITAETTDKQFHDDMHRAVLTLKVLDDRQHLFALECLMQFIFSAQDNPLSDFIWPKFRFGQHESDRIAQFMLRRSMNIATIVNIDTLEAASRQCGWWCPLTNICIMVERPTELYVENNGLLHRFNEQACRYEDSWGFWALRGIQVPAWIARGEFDAKRIDQTRNIELRRVMVDRYGVAKYLQESGAQLISEDEYGKLYKKTQTGDEDIAMVEVTNSSPEPDGTFKTYFLRVPPTMRTARQAIAWTFSVDNDEYGPTIES
jgi:hypothetical protein